MNTVLFLASILAAVSTADYVPSGRQMVQYCDSENLEGPCFNLDDSQLKNCVQTLSATVSIDVFDGFECSMFLSGGCGPSGEKTWTAGTYNSVDAPYNESTAIDCYLL
ncbi:hypothetical protein PG985_012965 [Apiospora marii]|uniref:Uncharacterized protein n=1 Tax=Apiospora marii TaxID=335849 RepID=A0ABR1RBU9_9PEZI